MSHYNDYSTMLRSLSKKYYQNYIGFEEYRSQRKVILDKIDQQFNAHKLDDLQADESEQLSLSMNIFTLFKGNDIES
jgi:hypothetical protein